METMAAVREWAGTAEGRRITGTDLPPRPAQRGGGHGTAVSGVTKFQSATFEAKLHEAKFIASGEMRVILLIPDSDSDEGAKLKDAFPVRLQVRIENPRATE